MTAGTTIILELLGGVAMLLWGVRMVRTGIMRGWGDRLKQFIQQKLANNLSAFAAGGMATTTIPDRRFDQTSRASGSTAATAFRISKGR